MVLFCVRIKQINFTVAIFSPRTVVQYIFYNSRQTKCFPDNLANDQHKIINSSVISIQDSKITKEWNEKQPQFEIHLYFAKYFVPWTGNVLVTDMKQHLSLLSIKV